jgi:hypothetical protein
LYDNPEMDSIATLFRRLSDVGLGYTHIGHNGRMMNFGRFMYVFCGKKTALKIVAREAAAFIWRRARLCSCQPDPAFLEPSERLVMEKIAKDQGRL